MLIPVNARGILDVQRLPGCGLAAERVLRERELNAEATRFSGSSSAGVDGKGRIVLPADFRRVLEAKACNYFYATPDLQHPGFSNVSAPTMPASSKCSSTSSIPMTRTAASCANSSLTNETAALRS